MGSHPVLASRFAMSVKSLKFRINHLVIFMVLTFISQNLSAEISGSITASFSSSLTVGDTKTMALTFVNKSTDYNSTEDMIIKNISIVPSCLQSSGASCATPDFEVLQFSSGTGKIGTSCAGMVFNVSQADPVSGAVEILPFTYRNPVVGHSTGTGYYLKTCTILFNVKALRAPADSNPLDSLLTTDMLFRATFVSTRIGTRRGLVVGTNRVSFSGGSMTYNIPPVANAGENQTITSLATASFDGSDSYDTDGAIVSYSWNFGDGSRGSGATVSHTYVNAGKYSVILTVTDNSGVRSSSSVIITVLAPSTGGTGGGSTGGESAVITSCPGYTASHTKVMDVVIPPNGGGFTKYLVTNYGIFRNHASPGFGPDDVMVVVFKAPIIPDLAFQLTFVQTGNGPYGPAATRTIVLSEKPCDFNYPKSSDALWAGESPGLALTLASGTSPSPYSRYLLTPGKEYYLNIRNKTSSGGGCSSLSCDISFATANPRP